MPRLSEQKLMPQNWIKKNPAPQIKVAQDSFLAFKTIPSSRW